MLLSLPEQQRRQLLKAIGTLKKVRRLLSLIGIFMLLSLSISLVTGSSLVHVTMVTAVILVFFGLLLRLMNSLSSIEKFYVSKVLATDLADMILDLEAGDGNIKYGVLDSSLWHKRGDTGPSLAEQMIRKAVGGVRLTEVKVAVWLAKMKYTGVYR